MPEDWDDSLKIFISENAQDFATWLLEGSEFVDKLLTEFKKRKIKADVLLKVILNGKEVLLHIEFQSYKDPSMAQRLLEYNFEARREHNLPVLSCVIYLRDVGEVPEPPLIWTLPNGREVLRFDYQSVELAKIPTEEFRKIGLIGLLPLLVLTRDGAKREVVEEVITELEAAKKPGLLLVTELLASLALQNEEDQQWITWRFSQMFDILRETKAYKELTREGRREGEVLALRQVVVDVVQERFPELVAFTQKQVQSLEDVTLLRSLIVKMSTAKTLEEATQILNLPTTPPAQ